MLLVARFIAWLRRAPVEDPLDSRHAPAIQFLMLFMLVTLPANWAYHLFVVRTPVRPDMVVDLLVDILVWGTALASLRTVRLGRLKSAVKLFVTSMLVALATMYLSIGLTRQMLDQTYPVLTIVLGGLILGRRALWLIYGLIVLMMWGGGIVDVVHLSARAYPRPWLGAANAPSMSMSYFVITLVLDRCVHAMRVALSEARQTGALLAQANVSLRAEIVERQRAQEIIVHAQKMETAGRLSAGIAHDVNHLVAIVEGAAERSVGVSDPHELRMLIREIGRSAARARELIRRLTAFARRGETSPETFDVQRALLELRPMLRQVFSAGTVIDIPLCSPSFVWMDRSHFEFSVLNIAANARDAMTDVHARFSIALERVIRKGEPGVSITMTDNGLGMSPPVLDRACEPFFTTKASGEGTGLGLAMVHDLMVQNRGDLSLKSVTGQGTTVAIWLPERRLAKAAPPPVRLLLIQAEDDSRERVVSFLENQGCIVLPASTANEARLLVGHLRRDLDAVVTALPFQIEDDLPVHVLPSDIDADLAGFVEQIKEATRQAPA